MPLLEFKSWNKTNSTYLNSEPTVLQAELAYVLIGNEASVKWLQDDYQEIITVSIPETAE